MKTKTIVFLLLISLCNMVHADMYAKVNFSLINAEGANDSGIGLMLGIKSQSGYFAELGGVKLGEHSELFTDQTSNGVLTTNTTNRNRNEVKGLQLNLGKAFTIGQNGYIAPIVGAVYAKHSKGESSHSEEFDPSCSVSCSITITDTGSSTEERKTYGNYGVALGYVIDNKVEIFVNPVVYPAIDRKVVHIGTLVRF